MVAFSARLVTIAVLSITCTTASPLRPKSAKSPAITLSRNELNFNISSKALRMAGSAQVTKLHRSLDNFEINTGHVSSGAPSIAQRALMKRDPSEVEELNPVRGGVWWSADIDIGTPPVRFRVDLDTGSTDAWVMSSLCKDCAGHLQYDPRRSSSSSTTRDNFKIGYQDGSTVQGQVACDTITLGDYQVTQASFGAASIVENMGDIEAIFGLAYPSVSCFQPRKSASVYATMVEQGETSGQFSFSFQSSGGEFYLDGWNPDLCKGDFVWTDLVLQPGEDRGLWKIPLDAIKVNGKIALGYRVAVIDTGSNYVVGPAVDVEQIYALLGGHRTGEDGVWEVPCYQEDIALTFGGRDFVIPGSSFTNTDFTGKKNGIDYCLGMFIGMERLSYWIIGEYALRNWYTTFDYKQGRVGFASLR